MLLLSKVNIYERLRRRRRGWKEPSGRQGGAAARSHPAAPARRGDGQKRSSTGQGEPKYPRGISALPPGLGMLSQFSRALPSPARAAKEQWERMRSRHLGRCRRLLHTHGATSCPTRTPRAQFCTPWGLFSQPGWGRGGSSPAKLPDPRHHDRWAHPWGPQHEDKGWQRGTGTRSDPPNGTLAPSPWRQLQG